MHKKHCPIEITALILGKKWVPTIIYLLKFETLRLGEIQKLVGCSKKVLLDQLNLLIFYKIIEKNKISKGNTFESYYNLSDYGKELIPILEEMKKFGCKVDKREL